MQLSNFLKFSRFKNGLLTEKMVSDKSERRTVVFSFGRVNPPTKGHEKLINKVVSIASEKGADHYIFASQTNDPKKNPLSWEVKIAFLKKLFPHANISTNTEIKTAYYALDWFDKEGYTDIIFVVGADRVAEFSKMKTYTVDKGIFNSFAIESAGARDPDSEGVTGMSASNAREAAASNNIVKFRMATGWSGEISNDLMDAVRKGMGIDDQDAQARQETTESGKKPRTRKIRRKKAAA